jgi:predicted transcriptional regulator
MKFTANQLRSALALLGWTTDDLAKVSGISGSTIRHALMRPGTFDGRQSTVDAVAQALHRAGIELREGGVHRRERVGACK